MLRECKAWQWLSVPADVTAYSPAARLVPVPLCVNIIIVGVEYTCVNRKVKVNGRRVYSHCLHSLLKLIQTNYGNGNGSLRLNTINLAAIYCPPHARVIAACIDLHPPPPINLILSCNTQLVKSYLTIRFATVKQLP